MNVRSYHMGEPKDACERRKVTHDPRKLVFAHGCGTVSNWLQSNWPPQPDRCGSQVLRGKLPDEEEAFAMASLICTFRTIGPLWELGSVDVAAPRDPADDGAPTNSAFLRALRLWEGT
jgi:hypothetical protein